ncbi:permease-like cell division protein FtsX [Plantactinospora sp. GCM10030261]|uniref:permease-like cell division protein FtsX n=1 Tax=Plantactinospora sp. GCM10030261 TaxID=3273420 RepID=UPI0036098FF8
MDQNLRGLFERALGDEPVPPGNLSRDVMAQGRGLRRRRRLLATGGATGVVAVLATVVALTVGAAPGDRPPSVVLPAAVMPTTDNACDSPLVREAGDASIFLLAHVTDQQHLDLRAALQSDPLVRDFQFRSRDQAYVRFKELYRDQPDLVDAVTADQFPESYRVELVKPSEYQRFAARIGDMDGVDLVQDNKCPPGSPSSAPASPSKDGA